MYVCDFSFDLHVRMYVCMCIVCDFLLRVIRIRFLLGVEVLN